MTEQAGVLHHEPPPSRVAIQEEFQKAIDECSQLCPRGRTG